MQQNKVLNTNEMNVYSRPILSGISLNTLNQRQITKQQKVLDTQTVLQLIYQQQQFNEQANANQNSNSAAAQAAATRYKTELCRSYQENGICKYGDKCQFAHGSNELRTMSRHPKYKTELCRTFHAAGYCPYGPRCHFVHDTQIDNRNHNNSKQTTSPKQQLTLKLNPSSSCSSSSSGSSSTSPLSLNQIDFDINNDLDSLFQQTGQQITTNASNSLLMYACENDFKSFDKPGRKDSTSSSASSTSGSNPHSSRLGSVDSVFSGSSSTNISPPSSRSLSPDAFINSTNDLFFSLLNQEKSTFNTSRKFYDDWDLTTTDSIVNQILSNICSEPVVSSNDFSDPINSLALATANLLI